MTELPEGHPSEADGLPLLLPHQYQVSGTERINLHAIDPVLIGILADRFAGVDPGQWGLNSYDDRYAMHEERFRSLDFSASDPRLPTMTVSAVDKRHGPGAIPVLNSEYRFKFEKSDGQKTYEMISPAIKGDGSYKQLNFASIYEITGSGYLRSARPMVSNYYDAMKKIGLWDYITERLVEDEYTQPGIYGLKILDTILRGYLLQAQQDGLTSFATIKV